MRKVSQVGWSVICKPKNEGGLGFRRMFDANQALIMKLGWGLIYKPGSLWVRVLRGKYECGEGLIQLVRKKNRESLVWQGIRKTWEPLSKGLAWRLGDGNVMRFWSDRWLMSSHILKDVGVHEVPLEILDLPVSHFFEEGRGWKLFLFSNYLPCRYINEILSSTTPEPSKGGDRVFWVENSSGEFSTNSARRIVAEGKEQVQGHPIWKAVWRLKGPQRVRVFLWKLLNNGVLTNDLRVRRHMTDSYTCSQCLSHREDYTHAFRDCSVVAGFWRG